jgi:hypothetical protein
MNKLKIFLIGLLLCVSTLGFSQTGPAAPGTGIYTILAQNYTVGTSTDGVSKARLTFRNTSISAEKITGLQFRLFYDKVAFTGASVALVGSATNLDLRYVTDAANGFVTITLVYTGTSNTYTLPEGETFEVTFTHAPAASFYAINAISNLTWVGLNTYPEVAANQTGLDTVLTLHNYGGAWIVQNLTYSGDFTNVTGTPAKNLPFTLEKKVKTTSNWAVHNSYTTDANGHFQFTENIDLTYYDVRIAVNGSTMTPGNVISTTDAELVNQWVLGNGTPTAFQFYAADVNGSNAVTITDAYGIFGRVAGRFTSWPNNVKDIKFFTAAEYATITGSPSTNYTSTIPGQTDFYIPITSATQAPAVYYVMVSGDANGTGYHMARMTPITVSAVPSPGMPAAAENVIDTQVNYDFPTTSMELNLPSLSVNEGNLVEIPVTVRTNGESISALQFGMIYDQNLLEFKDIKNSEKSMFWLSFVNPTGGEVDWGGYDPSSNKAYSIPNNYNLFTLRFIAKTPQSTWGSSPLYTTNKFSGDQNSKDMSITPTNGILMVYKTSNLTGLKTEEMMSVYPNPTSNLVNIQFDVKESSNVKLCVVDMNGAIKSVILDKEMPAGTYTYSYDLQSFANGVYVAYLHAKDQTDAEKIIKK